MANARTDTPQTAAPAISVVVPVYKEESNIRPFLERVVPVLEKIGTYEILFCLDPSPDRTEEVIVQAISENSSIRLLVFSRRFGQPAAVAAGIEHCSGAACVVIDVDLQDPPELIADLHAKMREGYDVVYAKRRKRNGETAMKLLVAWLGYKVINAVSEVRIPRNTGDFRIMSRRVVQELRGLKEVHGFLRGLVAFVGFSQAFVEYDRDARAHGAGHYNRYIGSLKIGFNGLIGFSTFLLDLTLILGLAISFIAFLGVVYVLAALTVFGQDFPLGTPSILISILFLGGVQLISVGVIGQYVGRIYEEVKHRPKFIIGHSVNMQLPESGRL